MTARAIPLPTTTDDGLGNSLIASGIAHLVLLLLLFFGLPHFMSPLPPVPHPPVPFEIVTIADITNTRTQQPEETKQPPAPPPKPEPKPTPKQEQIQVQQLPPPKPPEPLKEEAIKPLVKPKPPEPKPLPAPDAFAKLLKNLEVKKPPAPKETDQKTDTKAVAQPVSQAPSLSNRLSISEEDALRRQISQCWNPPIGAKDAKNLIVEIVIDVNPDRTAAGADIVDKSRYASDPFFRAAAESARRAVLNNPLCSPLELPPDKYEQWKRITFTFDPRDIL